MHTGRGLANTNPKEGVDVSDDRQSRARGLRGARVVDLEEYRAERERNAEAVALYLAGIPLADARDLDRGEDQ